MFVDLHFCKIKASLRLPWLNAGTTSINCSNPSLMFCLRFCSDAIWLAFFSASLNSSWGAFRGRRCFLGCGCCCVGLGVLQEVVDVSSSLTSISSIARFFPVVGDNCSDSTELSLRSFLTWSTKMGQHEYFFPRSYTTDLVMVNKLCFALVAVWLKCSMAPCCNKRKKGKRGRNVLPDPSYALSLKKRSVLPNKKRNKANETSSDPDIRATCTWKIPLESLDMLIVDKTPELSGR